MERKLTPEAIRNTEPSLKWTTKTGRLMITAGYDHDFVCKQLGIEPETLPHNIKILSIGEGFSNFAKRLYEDFSLDIVAIDRLYSNPDFFNKSIEELSSLLGGTYKGRVSLPMFFPMCEGLAPFPALPAKGRIAAADINDLPFPEASLDRIYGHYVIQYVNLYETLPELCRILKDNGEIRFGGSTTQVIGKDKRLISGKEKYTIDEEFIREWTIAGFNEAIAWAREHNISVYVILADTTPSLSSYEASIIIFRKDNLWPDDIKVDVEESPWYPEGIVGNLGKVFKVKPELKISPHYRGEPLEHQKYFELIPRSR